MFKHLLVTVSSISLMAAVQQASAVTGTAQHDAQMRAISDIMNKACPHPNTKECSAIQHKALDGALNAAYAQVMGKLNPDQKLVLRNEQRQWLKDYKDNSDRCKSDASLHDYEESEKADCFNNFTEERIVYMMNYLQTDKTAVKADIAIYSKIPPVAGRNMTADDMAFLVKATNNGEKVAKNFVGEIYNEIGDVRKTDGGSFKVVIDMHAEGNVVKTAWCTNMVTKPAYGKHIVFSGTFVDYDNSGEGNDAFETYYLKDCEFRK